MPRIRIWPLVVIGLFWVGALAWAWGIADTHRQTRVLSSLAATVLSIAALVLWVLFLSRLPRRLKLAALAAVAALAGALGLLVEERGVTGDVMPVFGWRFASGPAGLAARTEPIPIETVPDYPQFLGPRRDGRLPGPRLARDWTAHPPRALWRIPVGAGWSAFAVAGGRAVTQEQHGEEETVRAYDLASGRLLWSHAEAARFEGPIGGPGPRATPSVEAGRVFAFGATGRLVALDLASGAPLWSRDAAAEHGASPPTYGFSASPLVLGGRVIVAIGAPGASLAAYDAGTGEPLWAAGEASAGYSSPIAARLAGREQIVVLTGDALVGHDAGSGAPLWSWAWPRATEKVAQPVVVGDDLVFASTGYGIGGKLLRIEDTGGGALESRLVWESQGLKAKLSHLVLREGHLYGLDDGRLACLRIEDGQRLWKGERYGHGQLILVGDLLLVQVESGEIALVEATPAGARELGRVPALDGKTWNHPALAGRYLAVRNDREAIAFELPLEGA